MALRSATGSRPSPVARPRGRALACGVGGRHGASGSRVSRGTGSLRSPVPQDTLAPSYGRSCLGDMPQDTPALHQPPPIPLAPPARSKVHHTTTHHRPTIRPSSARARAPARAACGCRGSRVPIRTPLYLFLCSLPLRPTCAGRLTRPSVAVPRPLPPSRGGAPRPPRSFPAPCGRALTGFASLRECGIAWARRPSCGRACALPCSGSAPVARFLSASLPAVALACRRRARLGFPSRVALARVVGAVALLWRPLGVPSLRSRSVGRVGAFAPPSPRPPPRRFARLVRSPLAGGVGVVVGLGGGGLVGARWPLAITSTKG